jgi:Sulfotransferase family
MTAVRAGQRPGEPPSAGLRTGPVIVLACAYAGAARVVEALAADPAVAATTSTGIIPLCGQAARTWQRLDGSAGPPLSQLAASTLRALITAQVTMILAEAGKTRWCELAIGATSAAPSFLQVFPGTTIVTVHRHSLDMIHAAVQASPWGLYLPRLAPYLSSYQGNTAAALAAYWADSTEQLLAFETANPQVTYRVRYEDAVADPDRALAGLRSCLGLTTGPDQGIIREPAPPAPSPASTVIPAATIPRPLLDRITSLHAQLKYPAPEEEA